MLYNMIFYALKEHNFVRHTCTNTIIESLIEQFDIRFSDFVMLRKGLIIFENLLIAQIKDQSLDLQAELCDLQYDLSLKTRLKKGIDVLKILNTSHYSSFRNFDL